VAVLVLRHLQLKRLLESDGNVEVERRVAKGTGPESLSVAVAVAVAAIQTLQNGKSLNIVVPLMILL